MIGREPFQPQEISFEKYIMGAILRVHIEFAKHGCYLSMHNDWSGTLSTPPCGMSLNENEHILLFESQEKSLDANSIHVHAQKVFLDNTIHPPLLSGWL